MKLLGKRLMSRDFDHQNTELKVSFAFLHEYNKFGTPSRKP
ncbi:hypothetical protein JSE7799_02061 [Jannaschia seosinensis]|uniref:Uncharacterized protein n=1 Tax=Jannaschia seosinensis TaxID=313367 RepID=A0A0M7B974_9RHOB|nr:hypothetical protein [Jannaschia seosinensis]CUH39337.1 hypothetical protein JSE7799_02061 [Jannaschia seosinensis]